MMRVVTIDVGTLDTVKQQMLAALDGVEQGERISFPSPELMFKVLTGKRWELLHVLTGAGPMSIREAARKVGRDVKAVHGDVMALLNAGVLNRNEHGRIEFPYDEIHVDFVVKKAA